MSNTNKCRIKLLNNSLDWIEEITGEKFKEDQNIEETARNFYSSYTHPGLIWYFYLCWVNGYGACLRTDMIWTSILHEISIMASANKSSWGHVFDFSQIRKEMTTTMNYNSAIDINELTSKCRKNIKDMDMFKILTLQDFGSKIPLNNYLNRMIFAQFCHGKFNNQLKYEINGCKNKINGLDIQGNVSDWNNLCSILDRLIDVKNLNKKTEPHPQWGGFENFNSKTSGFTDYIDYIKRCRDTVKMIISYKFKKNPSEQANFFKNIFSCSGTVVDGWIRNFYYRPLQQDICKFNSHLSYIPYKSINMNNMEECFLQSGGLCYSVISNGVLYPQYGMIKFKIFDNTLYKKLRGIETNYFDKVTDELDQYKNNFKHNTMNQIISIQKPQIDNQQHPSIPESQPPFVPQSILFSLDRSPVIKPMSGEYLKAFDRDPTIPMSGGSLPFNY